MNNTNEKTGTLGEELYLVHLRRHQGEEPKPEDFDHEGGTPMKRDRGLSAGEELWQVYLKRSQGVQMDDIEDEALKEKVKPCPYNLRTRAQHK